MTPSRLCTSHLRTLSASQGKPKQKARDDGIAQGLWAECATMPLTITHNAAACRFEGLPQALPARDLAVCCYRRIGDVLVLHHTEVPRALQGQGLAGELVRAVLDWARAARLRVRPMCSYVAAYMQRHPETQDLLENDQPKPSEI